MNAAAHITYLCQTYGISKADLLGPSKRARLSLVRQELYFRLTIIHGLSLPLAGRLIGKRDHTTVLYGLRKYAERMFGTDPKASIERIREAARFAGHMEEAA